jgi:hypothetical protein
MSDSIAVGVPVYSRTDALEQFLRSLPDYVSTAYIADNGPDESKAERQSRLYCRDWKFSVEVLDLEHDAGIGPCRAAIADAVTEPYLWVGDCDMEIVRYHDLRMLRRILAANPDLGAVAGWLQEGDSVRSGARQLIEDDGTVYKTVPDQPDLRQDPLPHATMDMIPQAGLWRTAMFEDVSWDASVFNSEHIDFALSAKPSDWKLASTPAVLVAHHRDIDPDYRESKRGSNRVDMQILERKHGVQAVHVGERPDWVTTRDRGVFEQGFDIVRRVAPPALWTPIRRVIKGATP